MALPLRSLLLMALLPHSVPSYGQDPGSATSDRRPIEMRMGLGLLGSEIDYRMDGKNVGGIGDLERIILPLGDEEASRLIRGASDADAWSWGFLGAGLVLGVVTALTVPPTEVTGVDFLDRGMTGGFFAQFLILPGTLFQFSAQGHKFNAVQRYNRVVRGEAETSAGVPIFIFVRGEPGLGWKYRF